MDNRERPDISGLSRRRAVDRSVDKRVWPVDAMWTVWITPVDNLPREARLSTPQGSYPHRVPGYPHALWQLSTERHGGSGAPNTVAGDSRHGSFMNS